MALQVTLYARRGCGYCRQARQYLQGHGVAFKERDIGCDVSAGQELGRMNAPGVPVTVINGQAVFGFDKPRLDDLLKANGVSIGPP